MEAAVNVLWIKIQCSLVRCKGLLVLQAVLESTGEVEVALGCFRIQLDGQLVGVDGVGVLPSPVVGIAQVVEGRIVKRVQPNGFQVVLNGLQVVTLVAVAVA